jgi:hypothetical protein
MSPSSMKSILLATILISCNSSVSMGFHLIYRTLAFCHICCGALCYIKLLICSQVQTATICPCSHSKASSSANNLSVSGMSFFAILQLSLLLQNKGFNFFNVVNRPNDIYLQRKCAVHFWFVIGVNLLS